MKTRDPRILSTILSERIGLALSAHVDADVNGEYLSFVPSDIDSEDGFSIQVRTGLGHIAAEFVPGAFSRPMLRTMGSASTEQKLLFKSFANAALNRRYVLRMVINDKVVDPVSINTWPQSWKDLSINIRMPFVDMHTGDDNVMNEIIFISESITGMILSLLPTEDISNESVEGYAEGNLSQTLVNKYERHPLNRAACIQLKGTSCAVCDFNFKETYGSLGEGFIHIHHLTPVSQLGSDYVIDPVKDLVPVCPNCHYMLHRRTPPLTIEELRKVLQDQKTVL